MFNEIETRVMLVENHRLLRKELRRSIELDKKIEVVAELDNGQVAIESIEKYNPDIIFMDINMPVLDGIEASKQIIKNNPKIKIITLSMHQDINYLRHMLNAGVSGYMLKTCSGRDMSEAVKTVRAGQKYFCPEILDLIDKYKIEFKN